MNNIKVIFQFNEISLDFKNILGEKALSIGNIFHLSIPTSPGFVVSADALNFFLDMSNLSELIKSKFYNLSKDDEEGLKNVSSEIEDLIMKTALPPHVEKEILRTYSKLSGFSDAFVSVRASYIFKDIDYLGSVNQTTFLNIKGFSEIILAIKACWASLYEVENIKYRLDNGIDPYACSSAVIIQKMLQTEASGITFSVSPINNDHSEISTQAVLGIIDIIKEGEVKPDSYHIDKETFKFKEKAISRQEYMLIRNIKSKNIKDSTIKTKVSSKWQENQKIDDKTLITIAKYAMALEDMYKSPQEIEWVIEKGKVSVLKTINIVGLPKIDENINKNEESNIEKEFVKEDSEINPIIAEKEEEEVKQEIKQEVVEIPPIPTPIVEPVVMATPKFVHPEIISAKTEDTVKPEIKKESEVKEIKPKQKTGKTSLLLTGIPASPGIVEGFIKVLKNLNEADPNSEYDIIVLENLTENWKEIAKHSKGIILDNGEINSYETEIARELSIPCIINTQIATNTLTDNTFVILDGSTGRLYEVNDKAKIDQHKSIITSNIKSNEAIPESSGENVKIERKDIKTATKFYTRIVDINLYESIAKSGFDGVYISAEDLILDLKIHPKQIFSQQKNAEYIDEIAKKISKLCDAIGNDKNVIYTISNLTSNELFELEGGVQFEVKEENPIIGYRGTLRNIKEIEILNMELEIVRTVRNKYGYKNLWIMIPYIRTIDELVEMKKLIISSNLRRSSTFNIFIDIEVPSNVIMIDELLEIGIDGINIDYKNLAQMILGIDFTNPKINKDNVNYHPTMLKSIDSILDSSNKYKIINSISLEDIDYEEDFLRYIIKRGVNIINTQSDNIYNLKEKVLKIETDILVNKR